MACRDQWSEAVGQEGRQPSTLSRIMGGILDIVSPPQPVIVIELSNPNPHYRRFRVVLPTTGRAEPISDKHGLPKLRQEHPNPRTRNEGQRLVVVEVTNSEVVDGQFTMLFRYAYSKDPK